MRFSVILNTYFKLIDLFFEKQHVTQNTRYRCVRFSRDLAKKNGRASRFFFRSVFLFKKT
jgi:hypothetical protein